MTPQSILLYAGIALLCTAVVLLGLAVRTYVVLDIRTVRDDLAGRRRTPGPRTQTVTSSSVSVASQDDVITQVAPTTPVT